MHASTCRPKPGIQDVFRHLANDQARTDAISGEIEHAFSQGRKVLVLTERTDHLDAIAAALDGKIPPPFVLHGRMSRKQRAALIGQLEALPPEAPRSLRQYHRERQHHHVGADLGVLSDRVSVPITRTLPLCR